jgi:hypothetical protein
LFASRYLPCPDCGASIDRAEVEAHRCDQERLVDFTMFGLRHEVDELEQRFQQHLESSRGRFEVWLAARDVRLG